MDSKLYYFAVMVALDYSPEICTLGPSPVRNVLSSSKTSKKLAHSGSSDEDPYSLTPSGSSGSSGKETARDRSRKVYISQTWMSRSKKM